MNVTYHEPTRTAPPTSHFGRTTFRFQNFLGEDGPRPPFKLALVFKSFQLKIGSAVAGRAFFLLFSVFFQLESEVALMSSD